MDCVCQFICWGWGNIGWHNQSIIYEGVLRVECAQYCLLLGFVLRINCSDAPLPFFAQMPPRPPPGLIHLVTSFPELWFCVVVTLRDLHYIYLEKILRCPSPHFFCWDAPLNLLQRWSLLRFLLRSHLFWCFTSIMSTWGGGTLITMGPLQLFTSSFFR